MSGVRAGAIVLAGRLLHYPGDDYLDDVRAFAELARQLGVETMSELKAFVAALDGRSVGELQELFTQTFDLTPSCALEVGWHLFGEEYERGAFLVDMRDELRTHAIPEGTELPDHLGSLLALVIRVEPGRAATLVSKALLPAIDKMLTGLREAGSPFVAAMDAIRQVLTAYAPGSPEVSHA
ncbi:MAG: nitrate reductase molybdenum cofactor assembly chaperone [Acidobacteria bacterium]|nr:nitrate reductase molybdenum cofactor assembly chaperone [Acidobacteriota bacterium]